MNWFQRKTGSLFLVDFCRKKYIFDYFSSGIFKALKASLIFNKIEILKEKLVLFPKEFLKFIIKIIILKKKKKFNLGHRNELLLNNLKKFDFVKNYYSKKIKKVKEQEKKFNFLSFFSYSKVYKNEHDFSKKQLWMNLIFIIINESFSKNLQTKEKRRYFFISKKIVFKLLKIGKNKNVQLSNKFLKQIFSWLKKSWNQKRLFAFFTFEKFLKNNLERIKIVGKKSKKYKSSHEKFYKFRRDNQISPSSTRTLKLCIIKLANCSRDFCLKIRKKSRDLLGKILYGGKFSEDIFFFIFQKMKNFSNEKEVFFLENVKKTKIKMMALNIEDDIIHKLVWKNLKRIFPITGKNTSDITIIEYSNILTKTNPKKKKKKGIIYTIYEILLTTIIASPNCKNILNLIKLKKKFSSKTFSKLILNLIINQKKTIFAPDLHEFFVSILNGFDVKKIKKQSNQIPSFFLNLAENDLKIIDLDYKKVRQYKNIQNYKFYLKYIMDKIGSKKNFLRKRSFFLSYNSLRVFSFKIPFFFRHILLNENNWEKQCSISEKVCFLETIFKREKINTLNIENIKFSKNHWFFLILSRIFIQNSKNEIKIWYSMWEFVLFFLYRFSIYPFSFLSRILEILCYKIGNSPNIEKKRFKNRFLLLLGFFSIFQNGKILFSRFNLEIPIKLTMENKIIYIKKKNRIKFKKIRNKFQKNLEIMENIVLSLGRRIDMGVNQHNFHFFSTFLRVVCFCEKITRKFFRFLFYFTSRCFTFEILSEYLIFLIDLSKTSPQLIQEQIENMNNIFPKKSHKILKSFIVFLEEIIKRGIVKNKNEFWTFFFQSSNKNLKIYQEKKKILYRAINGSILTKSNFFIDFIPFLIKTPNLTEIFFDSYLTTFFNFFNSLEKKITLLKKIIVWFKVYDEKKVTRKLIKFLTKISLTSREWKVFLANFNKIQKYCADVKNKNDILKMLLQNNFRKKKDQFYDKMLDRVLKF